MGSLRGKIELPFFGSNPPDPWDWYIYLHDNHKFMINVGKYTSPMDPIVMVGPQVYIILETMDFDELFDERGCFLGKVQGGKLKCDDKQDAYSLWLNRSKTSSKQPT